MKPANEESYSDEGRPCGKVHQQSDEDTGHEVQHHQLVHLSPKLVLPTRVSLLAVGFKYEEHEDSQRGQFQKDAPRKHRDGGILH